MVRKPPCQYCKQRRRKCEREKETDACARCIRMGKVCESQREVEYDWEQDEEDYSERYEDLCYEMEALESEIKTIESSLIRCEEKKTEPTWVIRVQEGHLILESELKSFREFELYGQSFMRYLSPFIGTFHTTSLVFKKHVSNVIQNAVSTVARLSDSGYSENKMYSDSLIVKCIDPKLFIARLVDLYFHCFNNLVPMIHEVTYRARIATLEHVLEDPVTLAICATASVHTCPHAFFNSQEKRYFGEFFYRKSMQCLVEIFDEPGRELESLVVTNTLQTFRFTTLRFSECRKWANLGCILATHLEQEYPDHRKGRELKDYSLRVFYSTIHRNSLYAHSILSLVNYIADHRHESPLPNRDPFDVLEDERDIVKSMAELINMVMMLEGNRAAGMLYLRSQMTDEGAWMELTFEDIIRFEGVVDDWWKCLPDYLKMGQGPMNCSKELIQNCEDPRQLLTCLYIHGLAINVQSNFLSPKDPNDISHVLKERACQLVVYSAEMVLATVRRFAELNTFCFSPAKLLVRSMDALLSIVQSDNKAVDQATKERIQEYLQEFKKSISPDHQYLSYSPKFSATASEAPVPDYELYQRFPLPSEAMLYDIVSNSVKGIVDL